MKIRPVISMFLALTASLLVTSSAFALKGTVVKQSGDTYIIETQDGYTVATLDAGYSPEIGDVLVGDMDRKGLHTLYNLTADEEVDMVIEKRKLTRHNDDKAAANISIKIIMGDRGYDNYQLAGNYEDYAYNKKHKKDKHEHEEEDD